MPVIIPYLFKLSLSIAVIYLFYYLVLRRLTFYNLNRWYLMGYTAICFIIPLINIGPLLHEGEQPATMMRYIPTVQNITVLTKQAPLNLVAESNSIQWWDIALLLTAIGAVVLLVRLIIQFISLRNIRQKANILSDTDATIYHIDEQIMPFSFGNAIYINKNLHTDTELEDIILHEYVHVKQRHTADILLAELLCIVNWYNPAAWLIRHSIRQNLEFIADDNVVRSGLDKKAYQYHLLKVVGIPQYSIANQFNFSSLKTRIIMMNKLRSAKINLLRFLFILPLLSVTLMAFRDKLTSAEKQHNYAVIFYDLDTQKPIPDVTVKEIYGTKTYTANAKGYVNIPVKLGDDNNMHISMLLKKSGYTTEDRRFMQTIDKTGINSVIELIGLRKGPADRNCNDCFLSTAIQTATVGDALYTEAYDFYHANMKNLKPGSSFVTLNTNPLIAIDTVPVPPKVNAKKNIDSTYLTITDRDTVIVNTKEKRVVLNGNLVYSTPAVTIKGSRIVLDTNNKQAGQYIVLDGKPVTLKTLKGMAAKNVTGTAYVVSDDQLARVYDTQSDDFVVVNSPRLMVTGTPLSTRYKVAGTLITRFDSTRALTATTNRSFYETAYATARRYDINHVYVGNDGGITLPIDAEKITDTQLNKIKEVFAQKGMKFELKNKNSNSDKAKVMVSLKSETGSSASGNYNLADLKKTNKHILIMADNSGNVSIATAKNF